MRPSRVLVEPQLLEQVVTKIGFRGRRCQCIEKREQLRRPTMRTRDVLDECVVPIGLRPPVFQGLEFDGGGEALDLLGEEGLDGRSQRLVTVVHYRPPGSGRVTGRATASALELMSSFQGLTSWCRVAPKHGIDIGCSRAIHSVPRVMAFLTGS